MLIINEKHAVIINVNYDQIECQEKELEYATQYAYENTCIN